MCRIDDSKVYRSVSNQADGGSVRANSEAWRVFVTGWDAVPREVCATALFSKRWQRLPALLTHEPAYVCLWLASPSVTCVRDAD
jgi:hypothetical protein